MFHIALETSATRGGVALADDDNLVEEISFEEGMVHGRDLVPSLVKMLKKAALAPRDLAFVSVDVGPGSYTGVRVGVAAAKMIAYALRCPVASVVSTDVLAENAGEVEDFLCPVIDARWEQVYAAFYRRDWVWMRVEGPKAWRPEELAARLPAATTVFGSGLERYAEIFARWPKADPALAIPKAAAVARLGWQAFQAGACVDAMGLRPLYLRPTEAEVKFGVAETSPPAGC